MLSRHNTSMSYEDKIHTCPCARPITPTLPVEITVDLHGWWASDRHYPEILLGFRVLQENVGDDEYRPRLASSALTYTFCCHIQLLS